MSTRSFIAKQNPDGSLTGIYCPFHGYPSGVGATLREHYTNPAKVDELLALGSISSLGKEIGEKHDFNARVRDWCNVYMHDRGETDQEAYTVPNINNAFESSGYDYAYVFVGSEWQFTNRGNRELEPLTLEACEEENSL